jgi:hypothetical protein
VQVLIPRAQSDGTSERRLASVRAAAEREVVVAVARSSARARSSHGQCQFGTPSANGDPAIEVDTSI